MPSQDTTDPRSGFFAIGQQTFHEACALGINAASAFLVLARGTGPDNATTSWSAKAVRERAAVRNRTAVEAIQALVTARLAKKSGTVARPKYKLHRDGDLIWLPNAIVDGVGAEKPPVARIRETQDVMLLRMFIDLYSAQNLAEDGGIDPYQFQSNYSRRRVGQRGAWIVWAFSGTGLNGHWTPITEPHRLEKPEDGENSSTVLWNRVRRLESFGLISWVPYVFDGPEGEPMYAVVPNSGIPIEQDVYAACEEAVVQMLTDNQYEIALEKGGELVPVPAHVEQAQLIGIARLRYRPHTGMTKAWWANHQETCLQLLRDLAPYTGYEEGQTDAA